MFKTIRSKILSLIIGLMVLTSMTFLFITTKNYQAETTKQYYRLAKETVDSTIRVIDAEYNDLVSFELDTINNQRALMKTLGTTVLSMVDSFHDQQNAGLLTEQLAKEQCLNRIQQLRYQNGQYFFVYDMELTGLSHPNRGMVGKKWSGFQDLKKSDSLSLIRDIIETKKTTFTVFMWPRLKDMKKVKQLGFFFYYPQWKWIIGTTYEMGGIERISKDKEKYIASKINKIISKASLNDIGGMLIFDNHGKRIVYTSNLNDFELHSDGTIINIERLIQNHLEKESDHTVDPAEDSYTAKDNKRVRVVYEDHFKDMGWHVVSFIDRDELAKPVVAIAVRQTILIVLVLLIGIVFAVFISQKITLPIAILTKYSRDLPNSDFTVKSNPMLKLIKSNNQNDEITQLADAFGFMESELGKTILDLEQHQKNLAGLVDIRTNELTNTNKNLNNEINERKLTEIKLLESERKYKQLFINAPAGIYEIDFAKGRFVIVNEIMSKYFGYSEKEFLSMNPLDILSEDSKKLYVERIEKAFAGEKLPGNFEYTTMNKDGQTIDIIVNNDFLYKNGELTGARGVANDISALKQAVAEKIKAQKIAGEQEKLALIGQVAGKMAHDFNNLLGIIMGNAEIALLDCTDPEVSKTLKLIFEQTIRGKNLTKNLITFAKNQEAKQKFFKVNEKIDLVLTLLKKDLKDISLIKDYDSNMPELLGDPGMTEHALINIVQNSIHATSKVEQPQILVRTFHKDKNIYIEIEDNGCGIPEEMIGRIYEPAFTMKGGKDVTNSYQRGIKGTGYGMANVKKYIEQHNGNIQISSKIGSGTKITINLPVIQKKLTEKEIIEIRNENFYFGKNILLVEDERAISYVQNKILTHEPCNHKVDVADTGEKAVDLFDKNKYDFISLDYILPGLLNGMDVYKHIRGTNETIPILFASGNLDFLESIKELKNKDPFMDHVSKPCQNKDYINSINELLGRT